MTSIDEVLSAGDRLWSAVMQNEIDAHGNPQGKKWRKVNKQAVACDSCKDSGTTVLIRCGHEKCPREYHIDCAFHQGGLSLDDDGILNVFCESHFKALVFCSCKEEYDDARPMVYCDECCDWFHNKCEGLSANEAAALDKYTCKNCREILKQGRTVSKVIKEKNMAKENRSVYQQNASKAVGLLSELEGGLCPIIDEICTRCRSQWRIRDIEEAKSVVSAPPFAVPSDESTMSDGDQQSADLLRKLGVMPVVNTWRSELLLYLDKYHKWYADAQAYFQSHVASLAVQLDKAQIEAVEKVRADLVALSDRASAELVGTPADLEGFAIFLDCVIWMSEFLQVLHVSPKPDNWIPVVGSSLRGGAARYKHLASHSKDFFCGAFVELFQAYHKQASQQVAAMNSWYNETYKILSTEMDYSLTDLDAYLRSAQEFPATPLLYEELNVVVSDAWAVERDINRALEDGSSSAELLGELTVKKNNLGVALPSEQKLAVASDRHMYLKACELALAQPRLRSDLVQSLVAQSAELLSATAAAAAAPFSGTIIESDEQMDVVVTADDGDKSSPLFEALSVRVKQASGRLSAALSDAAAVISDIGDLDACSEDPQLVQLSRLRSLQVITPEEEVLEFIQTAKSLQAEAERVMPTATDSPPTPGNNSVALQAVQKLVEQIETTLKITVVDRFEAAHKHKTALSRLLTTLVDQEVAAERLWSVVSSAIGDCQRGVAVSQEALQTAVAEAEGSRVRDEGIAQQASELLQRAQQEEVLFAGLLEGIVDATEENVRSARTMVEQAQCLPLTSAGAQRLIQRSTLCTAVFESERVLAAFNSTQNAALSEREMHTLRELSNTINKLSAAELAGVELELLNSVKDRILLFLWRAEVHFLWLHPIAPAAAELIRSHGDQLGDAAHSCPEWTELNAEIQRGASFLTLAEALLADVERLREECAADPTQWLTASAPLEERLRSLVQTDATLRIKTASITTALTENLELFSLMRSAQATLSAVQTAMAATATPFRPVADFKEITYFVNQLSSLAEKHESFSPLRSLREDMCQIHSAASQWNESAINFLPQKATRNKLKPDSAQFTMPQLLNKLAEPIARAVSTPMHEKFKAVLSEIDSFRIAFMAFLLPPDFPVNDTCNFQSPVFTSKLQEDMVTIGNMRNQVELIPLDMPEFRVLQWVSALFEWIHAIPYPGDDPKQHAIPMEVALKRIEESEPIVGTIPGNVIETLCQLGAMNLDEAAGPVGFHANIHPFFNLAGDLSDHLEQQVKRSQQLELRIKQAVETKHPAKDLAQLLEESATLLVQVSASVRRSVDRLLNKSGGRLGLGRGLAQSESESSEYSGNEEDEDAEVDNYWTEKTTFKTKSSGKRAREVADSLVSTGASKKTSTEMTAAAKKSGEEKPAKKNKTLCTNPDCPTSANKLKNSLYCSNHCAMVTASQVLSALVAYRKQLCVYGCAQRRLISLDDACTMSAKVFDADWKAYANDSPAMHEAVADIVAGMKGAGFIAESQNPSRLMPSRSGDPLEVFLVEGERRAQLLDGGAFMAPEGFNAGAERKTTYIQSILSALPPAAGPVFLRGDAEGLSAHSAAVRALGGSPVQVGLGSKGTSNAAVDEELRLKIRYGLEELLERTLSRLQVAGAANHAAFIALEFEEELCLKHSTAESKLAKKGLIFDKKEYRKHYLMLVSNLRKAHNDQLVLKLLSNEISIESLLEMTAVQLADSSTQLRRQQQLSNVVKDALRESTQETLEAARRQVMAGTDADSIGVQTVVSAQEDSDAQRTSLTRAASSELDLPPSPKQFARSVSAHDEEEDSGGSSMDVVSGSGGYTEEASPKASSRSLEIEQMVSSAAAASPRNNASKPTSSSGATPKRPMDADAISRFTTSSFKPNKVPRIETDSADGASEGSTPRGVSNESPRPKPASLLSSILSNKVAVAAATASPRANAADFHYEDINAASIRVSSGAAANSTTLHKLINSEGTHEISIVRPVHGSSSKNIVMKGEALVADRKLQGILSTPSNIDGRVKLDEFKRIINKVLTMLEDPRSASQPNRKHLSVFKMTVQDDAGKQSSASYEQFCSEFTRDLRVGYSNLGGGNSQLYVLPPAHKDCLPIFACLDESQDSVGGANLLYGVLTSKDAGPEMYTQEDFSGGAFSWDETPTVSAKPTTSTSSGIAMVKSTVIPAPPAPPSIPKIAKPSGVLPPVLPPRAPVVPPPAVPVVPAAVAAPPAPPPAVVAKPAEDPIQRVANFVATRGMQMMRELQAKPETRSVMPFLFDTHPDHAKFLLALKAAMDKKNTPL